MTTSSASRSLSVLCKGCTRSCMRFLRISQEGKVKNHSRLARSVPRMISLTAQRSRTPRSRSSLGRRPSKLGRRRAIRLGRTRRTIRAAGIRVERPIGSPSARARARVLSRRCTPLLEPTVGSTATRSSITDRISLSCSIIRSAASPGITQQMTQTGGVQGRLALEQGAGDRPLSGGQLDAERPGDRVDAVINAGARLVGHHSAAPASTAAWRWFRPSDAALRCSRHTA